MSKEDITTKDYMRNTKLFADAFNYLFFEGVQKLKPDDLKERDSVELGIIFKENNTEYVQKIRDVLKRGMILTDGRCAYLVLGIENQSEIHMAMPVKTMIYDALNYGAQVNQRTKEHREKKGFDDSAEFLSGFKREDKLYPVITLVIYWGSKEWDAPRSLYEMFGDVDEQILKYVNDYDIHVIVPKEIEDFGKFHTELGAILEFIAFSDDMEKMKQLMQSEKFANISREGIQVLDRCTGTKIQKMRKRGKVVNVCKAWDDMARLEREAGRVEGKAEGRIEGKAEGMGLINKLNLLLMEKGLLDDLRRSFEDRVFQEELLKEYQLI